MSDDSCIQCTSIVLPLQEALQCDGCQRWQHRICNTGKYCFIIIINYYSLCSHALDYLDEKAPDFFQKDVVVGDNRHLIFYTERQLQLLAKAKTWYMDGTFKIVNHPWQQMSF